MEGKRVLMSVAEVCDYLGVARDTWDKWRCKGRSPRALRLPNGELRIDARELDVWLDELGEAA